MELEDYFTFIEMPGNYEGPTSNTLRSLLSSYRLSETYMQVRIAYGQAL